MNKIEEILADIPPSTTDRIKKYHDWLIENDFDQFTNILTEKQQAITIDTFENQDSSFIDTVTTAVYNKDEINIQRSIATRLFIEKLVGKFESYDDLKFKIEKLWQNTQK